jgi:hypothetical protein
MAAENDVLERNRELARQINAEARANPHSPYAGKLVGIANGKVIAVTEDWNDLAKRLREAEPDPKRTFGLKVGVDYDAIQEIWESR